MSRCICGASESQGPINSGGGQRSVVCSHGPKFGDKLCGEHRKVVTANEDVQGDSKRHCSCSRLADLLTCRIEALVIEMLAR